MLTSAWPDRPDAVIEGLLGQLFGYAALGRLDSLRAVGDRLGRRSPDPALALLAYEMEAVLRAFDPDPAVRRAPAALGAVLDRYLAFAPRFRVRAAWASGLLAIRSGDSARARIARGILVPGPAPLREMLAAVDLAERGDAAGALGLLPAMPALDTPGESPDPLLDAGVRLLRAEQLGRRGDHAGERSALLWYQHLQTIGRGTGPPQPGEIGWAAGTLARWRLAELRISTGTVSERRAGAGPIRPAVLQVDPTAHDHLPGAGADRSHRGGGTGARRAALAQTPRPSGLSGAVSQAGPDPGTSLRSALAREGGGCCQAFAQRSAAGVAPQRCGRRPGYLGGSDPPRCRRGTPRCRRARFADLRRRVGQRREAGFGRVSRRVRGAWGRGVRGVAGGGAAALDRPFGRGAAGVERRAAATRTGGGGVDRRPAGGGARPAVRRDGLCDDGRARGPRRLRRRARPCRAARRTAPGAGHDCGRGDPAAGRADPEGPRAGSSSPRQGGGGRATPGAAGRARRGARPAARGLGPLLPNTPGFGGGAGRRFRYREISAAGRAGESCGALRRRSHPDARGRRGPGG